MLIPSTEMGAIGRRIMPAPVFGAARRIATALLTPLSWSLESGHFLSSLRARAVDKSGEPLPWYTYPCVHFVERANFTGRSVLEFGAGQSTLWWEQRAARVVAFDADPAWHAEYRTRVKPSTDLHLVDKSASGVRELLGEERFDVVIVDGVNRVECARVAVDHVTDDGAVIIDNSDVEWSDDGSYPMMDLMRDAGFQRVDFYGHAPGVILPHCTSLFFRERCFLLRGSEPPARP